MTESSTKAQQQPLYFWKETDPKTGWLSQWYYCPFKDDKNPTIIYETAEHYMMYQKAILFKDQTSANKILKRGQHPRRIKALGRKVENFVAETWKANRETIVRKGNYLKFTNAVTEEGFCLGETGDFPLVGGSLRGTLLATGKRELVEASPFDTIWGIGYKEADAGRNREYWGLNLLGKAIVEVRDMLEEENLEKK